MRAFSSLLSEFVERAGIPDADLARRMGVSRQTVFRWREGTTRAPRRRGDILSLARLLRLDPAERDDLLLSAGFPPEGDMRWPSTMPADDAKEASQAERLWPSDSVRRPSRGLREAKSWFLVRLRRMPPWQSAGLPLLAVVILLALWGTWRIGDLSVETSGQQRPAPARSGETLVLVGEFANYGGADAGFNVAGRLREAIRKALDAAGLNEVRVELWPETIADHAAAAMRAEESGATAMVWGEYDSGRVVARISANPATLPIQGSERRWLLAEPSQLNTTVNVDLPESVQWMAMLVLGQVDYWTGRNELAEAAFHQALTSPTGDAAAMATAYSYLGAIEARKAEPDLDLILAHYSLALEHQPGMTSALNNRGVAYLQRDTPGDIHRAEADFRQAVTQDPSLPQAPFNLALALLRDPANDAAEALQLLRTAESLDPLSPGVHNALCWTLSLEGRPAEAMPSCDKAVALDTTGNSYDSRALALALLGRFAEAVSDLERFLALAEDGDPLAYAYYSPTREVWLRALKQGNNPFTPEVLERLRSTER